MFPIVHPYFMSVKFLDIVRFDFVLNINEIVALYVR
jgi:hypothetical protein